MELTESRVVLFDLPHSSKGGLADILGEIGWCAVPVAERAPMLALLEERAPAAVVIDGGAPAAAETVAAIRRLAAPANGTPILVLGGEGVQPGAGGRLPLPLDRAAFVALLREWAGPLEADALRAAPYAPRYRLIRLIGLAAADAMLERFRDALREALDIAARDPGGVPAHRLAGIAGMVGHSDLGALWSRVDRGETGALPLALDASRRALD